MKTVIYEFNPVIYPFKLWVAIDIDFELLSDRFYQGYNKEILTNRSNTDDSTTFLVHQKKKPFFYGTLIVFWKRNYCNMNYVAHESCHAADYLLKHIHENSIGEEQYAYLVGWIADCIWKVKTNKVNG